MGRLIEDGEGGSGIYQREQNASPCTLHSSNPFNIVKALKNISEERREGGNVEKKKKKNVISLKPLRLL